MGSWWHNSAESSIGAVSYELRGRNAIPVENFNVLRERDRKDVGRSLPYRAM